LAQALARSYILLLFRVIVVAMSPTVESLVLDDVLQARMLAFVMEPKAALICHAWKDQLYNSLQLAPGIRFKQLVHEMGDAPLKFFYEAIRPLGEDFEETVGFHFEFFQHGRYHMQWTRTFDAWSSQSEQQFGTWQVQADGIICETKDLGREETDREVRYAPAGWKYRLPLATFLKNSGTGGNGGHIQAPQGAPAASWELTARIGKVQEEEEKAIHFDGMWQPVEGSHLHRTGDDAPAAAPAPRSLSLDPDARYVEVDGEVHEVSGDIVANWPEADWPRLMKCRLRFGICG